MGLGCDLQNLKTIKKSTFKNKVKRGTLKIAFDYLMNKKEKHSKLSNLVYSDLKIEK